MTKSSLDVTKAVNENGSILTNDQINTLIKASIIPKGTPVDQIMVFAQVCRERGLSPFSKEIYLLSYNTKHGVRYSIVTGIDGFRKIAARTGELAGCDDAKYDLKSDGSYKTAADLKIDKALPVSATVTVYRLKDGQKTAYTGTCLFDEFAAKFTDRKTGKTSLMGMWATMPIHMIAKCAEAFALKKGFDDELTGIREESEMAAMSGHTSGTLSTKEDDLERKELIDLIKSQVAQFNDREDLGKYFMQNPAWRSDDEIIEIFQNRVNEISNGSN